MYVGLWLNKYVALDCLVSLFLLMRPLKGWGWHLCCNALFSKKMILTCRQLFCVQIRSSIWSDSRQGFRRWRASQRHATVRPQSWKIPDELDRWNRKIELRAWEVENHLKKNNFETVKGAFTSPVYACVFRNALRFPTTYLDWANQSNF